ncbi:molybdopterin-synthase adenylyltransferase MoeB [Haliea sp. E1-2-M8]|uniref:HesA/MoeB/ThiF family protein n=1 Tax=Haliea sp. E1-2-M8 TaxID=3064706 RepID=UPI0027282A73|nr:molybdopterin-synthase adenylyltransferase MoeB [Haliea sp. E1-2-M8]MDO8861339.1 molybdopterin-synthase adenylyltransferase MoeB [Haliea sp. E1-2-M8]
MLGDADLERYSRQLLVPEVDVAGQEALAAATVLVVGLGGLGCPATLYLAAAGIGTLRLADGDRVELSNLQRQVAHTEAGLGDNKAVSAARAVRAINRGVRVEVIDRHLDARSMLAAVEGVGLVLDASDRFATRYALNRVCVAAGVPLLSAAAIRMEGQLALFDTARGGPCYRCLYPDAAADDSSLACAENGVLGPVVGVLGSLQALEAIKYLVGMEQNLRDAVLMLDLRSLSLQRLALDRRRGCPDCRPQ